MDPCEDFCQHVCGNWMKQTVISENKASKGVMSDLTDNIQLQVKGELTTETWKFVRFLAQLISCAITCIKMNYNSVE